MREMREGVQDIEALIRLRQAELSTEHLFRLRMFLDKLIQESLGREDQHSRTRGRPGTAGYCQNTDSASAPSTAKRGHTVEDPSDYDDDTDMTIALNEARVCEFVLTRSLTPESLSHVKSYVSQADLLQAVQGEGVRLPSLRQSNFNDNFEFCRALSLPFLDEIREELLVSFESMQFRTSPILGVTLEQEQDPYALVVGARSQLRSHFPKPPECLKGWRIEHHGIRVHGEVEGGDLSRLDPNSIAIHKSMQRDRSPVLSSAAQSRLSRFQVVMLFQPGAVRISDVQRNEIAISVNNEGCYCFGILVVDKKADFPLLCILQGKLPSPDRSDTGAPTHCLALLNCNLLSSLRIAKALGRPSLHCPREFWQREVLAGKAGSDKAFDFVASAYSTMEAVQSRCSVLNESQQDVVLEQLCKTLTDSPEGRSSRVTLVQGPPGTGKTQTLAILLDLLLEFRHRTLICAPSNVAVAEVVQRLMCQRMVRPSMASCSGTQAQDVYASKGSAADCSGTQAQDAGRPSGSAADIDRFGCLQPEEWLDDACITHFFQEMSNDIPDSLLLVEPPQAFLLQQLDDSIDLIVLALDLRLPERDLILIPVNDAVCGSASSGTHWSLLGVRQVFQEWLFEYYDSLNSEENYRKACKLATTVKSLLQSLADGDVPDLEEQQAASLIRVETIQQHNGNDCGLFLLEFVERLVNRFPERPDAQDLLNPFDPAHKRAELRARVSPSPPNSVEKSDATGGRVKNEFRRQHCNLVPAYQELADASTASLAEMALVANERSADIAWGDIRSRVLIQHRAKRIKRVAQFWLGDGRGSVKPFLEQPPWVQKGSDPVSGLLHAPQRAWELWREHAGPSSHAVGPGNLSSAWSASNGMTEACSDLHEFIIFALKALSLIADRQLAELEADLPNPSVRPFCPTSSVGQSSPQVKWARALAAYRDIVDMKSMLLRMRDALEALIARLQELPRENSLKDPELFVSAASSSNGLCIGSRSNSISAFIEPIDQSNSNFEAASAERHKHAINAVLEAVRCSATPLIELLGLDVTPNSLRAEQQLKPALKKLRLLVHPDKVPDELKARATEAFKLLPQAWHRLERACRGFHSATLDESECFNSEFSQNEFAPGHFFRDAALIASKELLSVAEKLRKVSLFVCSAGCSTIQRALLQRCALIFCTLSVSGRPIVREQRMGSVVIDEACQSTEALGLVPLHEDVEHLLLVGDPQQLPPTVKSRFAERLYYAQSTFERVLRSGQTPRLLAVQYRMHPDILEWPNLRFYGGQVLTSESVLQRDSSKAIFERGFPKGWSLRYGPMRIFDTSAMGCSEEHNGHSICNLGEAECLLQNLQAFQHFCILSDSLKIGIISPYKAQVNLIQQLLAKPEYGWLRGLSKVSTVDGFQGRECDIIAISCVRTGDRIGFVKDHRRLNVAITRAKLKSWIFGNLNALEQGAPIWEDLGSHAKERGWVVSAALESPSFQYFDAESKTTSAFSRAASVDLDAEEAGSCNVGDPVDSNEPGAHSYGASGAIWQVRHKLPLHDECSAQSKVVTSLQPGCRCIQVKATVLAGGFVWIHVQTPDVAQGWVALASERVISSTHDLRNSNMEIVLDAPTTPAQTQNPRLISLDPFQICFTHDCISSKFSNGTLVDDAIGGILSGNLSWSAFPPMCVTKYPGDGRYYSLSNRRLFVCRVIANHGVRSQVNVHLYPFDSEVVQRVKQGQPKWIRSYSTRVFGKYVQVVSNYKQHQWPCRPRNPSMSTSEPSVSNSELRTPTPTAPQDVQRATQWTSMRDKEANCMPSDEFGENEVAELVAELRMGTQSIPAQVSANSRQVSLNVSVEDGIGAGLDLCPTRWGMMVEAIYPEPGQTGIAEGDTIIQIRNQPLVGIRETIEKVFRQSFEDGVQLLVIGKVEKALAEVPGNCNLDLFEQDLGIFADQLDVEAWLQDECLQKEVVVRGPEISFRAAGEELDKLIVFHSQS